MGRAAGHQFADRLRQRVVARPARAGQRAGWDAEVGACVPPTEHFDHVDQGKIGRARLFRLVTFWLRALLIPVPPAPGRGTMGSTRPGVEAGIQRRASSTGTSVPKPRTWRSIAPRDHD